MLDVRRLVVLCEVARCGSLSAAAQALTYTTSAVSQQIAALEREARTPLVERRARGVVLTEAGRVLVEHAERVFEELASAEAALADLAALREGRVRLASFATASARVVPAVVDAFHLEHPGIVVQIEQASSRDGAVRLRRGEVDIVLAVDQPAGADIDVTLLFEDPFTLAVHRTHPAARAPVVDLTTLAGSPWIDVPAEIPGGGVVARMFGRLGLAYRLAHQSEDYTAIHEMVGAGLGIALLPDLALFPPNPDVVLRPLGPDGPSRRVHAVTRRAALRSPAASALLAALLNYRPRSRPVDYVNAAVEPSR